MKFSILLSLITLVSSRATTETPNENARIVGGFQVQSIINYQAALVGTRNNQIFCGGSIIGANWILTAAHCTPNLTPQTFYVRVGSLRYDTGGQAVRVRRIISHPNYAYPSHDWDIALLQVDNIQFNNRVYPIRLPNENQFAPTGTTVLVSGWGDTSFQGQGPLNLRAVYVQLTNWNQCRQAYPNDLTTRMICGQAQGKDACQNDSGGPLALGNTLVGIVSFGFKCAEPGFPGVYTAVADSNMRGFIRQYSGI